MRFLPTVPAQLLPWLGSDARPAGLGYAAFLSGILVVAVGAWLCLGRVPRRGRAYRRVRRHLQRQDWRGAQAPLTVLRRLAGSSRAWVERVREADGECLRLAGDAALADGRFEESLAYYRRAAPVLGRPADAFETRVLGSMLADVRRRFGAEPPSALLPLLERVLRLHPRCPEAQFWQGLCHVRAGDPAAAIQALQGSKSGQPADGPRALDPFLYLGALYLREGRLQDALRALSEANRLAPDCPFVQWQLGMAVVASGGDTLAIRPLQRALGAGGLAAWVRSPQDAWIEGLPRLTTAGRAKKAGNGRPAPPVFSYVQQLAEEHPYRCPVLGGDVTAMLCQGQAALAEAHARLGRLQEAADLYQGVLQESPPTLPVQRGLGIVLARLGRPDQAFKHLRAVFERMPQDHRVAGYLALCAARGKPNRPEDRPNNLAWAVHLLGKYTAEGDAEWAGLYSAVSAEVRAAGVPISVADQRRLCDALASVDAADADAAAAYEEFAAVAPDAVRPEYAWLYCRAAQQHGAGGPRGLGLFTQAFADEAAARAFFAQRQWDFDQVQLTYLRRLATCAHGTPSNGRPAHAEFAFESAHADLLLDQSRRHEAAGNLGEATASVEVLLRLSPGHGPALDRLAELHYRQGQLDRAAERLAEWRDAAPADHRPRVRLAVVQHQRGEAASAFRTIDEALTLVEGSARATVAFVGARLALADCFPSTGHDADRDARAEHYLQECLRATPGHAQALWCLAALRSLRGDRERLAALAPAMRRPDEDDARFHFLAAVCHLAAEDGEQALAAARRTHDMDAAATAPPAAGRNGVAPPRLTLALAQESVYLMGRAHLQLGERAAALAELASVAAAASGSQAADHARALLGQLAFTGRDFTQAARWWSAVTPPHRAAWGLDRPLQGALLLTALYALRAQQYAEATEHLAAAEQLGGRVRPLLNLARVKAAQRLLAEGMDEPAEDVLVAELETIDGPSPLAAAARFLQQAVEAGCKDAPVAYLLALVQKRLGNVAAARTALRLIPGPDAAAALQLGVLALREAKGGLAAPLQLAEQEFARAWERCQGAEARGPVVYAAGYNLVRSRLALGRWAETLSVLPRLLEAAPADARAVLAHLHVLLQSVQAQNRDGRLIAALAALTPEDEAALLALVRGAGQLETTAELLKPLTAARPGSAAVRAAGLDAEVLRAKQRFDRCDAAGARELLEPLAKERGWPRATRVAVLNLLGCCDCLLQDYDGGARHFAAALHLDDHDARLQQNQALAHEYLAQAGGGRAAVEQADRCWERYLDLFDGRLPVPPGAPDYRERLTFTCLRRLGLRHAEREDWSAALPYLVRANRLRPTDDDVLENLFEAYNHLRRFEEAHEALVQLRQLRGDAPQLDLYEMEFVALATLEDADERLDRLEHLLRELAPDDDAAGRAGTLLDQLVEFLAGLNKKYGEQLHQTGRSLQDLPSDRVNWLEVHERMRALREQLRELRLCLDRCLALPLSESQRRQVQRLHDSVVGEMELCRSVGG